MIINIFSGLLLAAALTVPPAAGASTVYRWTDTRGQTHFSDTPPASGDGSLQELTLPASRDAARPEGLRAGERRALSAWKKRRQHQQQAASRRSDRANRELEQRHTGCRQARDDLHATRSRERRKQLSDFLRRHCW